ncbi:MAG: TonB-dependent receptor [Geobacteraceae bacterium]|nr:TonB-dependent receptor [Geobacteraceae bacterium]
MKRSRQKYAVALGLVLAVCGSAVAEEKTTQLGEVVVTATRDEVPIEQVGSSITVVTAKEIEQQQKRTVADALRMVPGVDVVRNGTIGGSTSIYIRGAEAKHTLVLLDGIELNDPSSTGGSFDFANLTTDGIERIEILRGPQSTLYGSSAIAGVINIITKKGNGPLHGYVSAEGGSFYTARESAGISISKDKLQYSLNTVRIDSNGISSASSKYGNTENDPYQHTNLSSRLSIAPSTNSDIDVILRFNKTRTALDNGGGNIADDPNFISRSEELFLRTQGFLSLFEGFWDQQLGISYSNQKRWLSNPVDTDHPFELSYGSYNGQNIKVDWQNTINLHKTNTLILGVEHKDESIKSNYHSEDAFFPYDDVVSRKSAQITSCYLQDQINLWSSWHSTIGVRIDDHSQFGTEATYRFTSAYIIKQTDTKLKGSYGTGFKAPSLYQLYSQYGNQQLSPEKSTGWDLGIEQSLHLMKTKLDITYFKNEIENMIDFKGISTAPYGVYQNISKASLYGVELAASVQPVDELSLKIAYTYTQTKNRTTNEELLRRPKNKISFDANYQLLKQLNINASITYVSSRNDKLYDPITFATQSLKLNDYVLVNLAASYDVTKNLQLFGRIDNLLDRQYEEVAGYGTPGIGAYGGVKVSF